MDTVDREGHAVLKMALVSQYLFDKLNKLVFLGYKLRTAYWRRMTMCTSPKLNMLTVSKMIPTQIQGKKIKISNHLYALLVNLSQHRSKHNPHTYVIISDYCLFAS